MKTDWKKHLEESGAVIENDAVVHFGNPIREIRVTLTGSIIADLSHLGLIEIYGDDAQNFLQNLTCNDIKQVSRTQSQLNAFCNSKGRVIAFFRVFMRGDNYFIQLPRELVEDTLKTLRMYVLRSKVTLQDTSDTLQKIHFSGPNAESQYSEMIGNPPSAVNQCVTAEGLTTLRLPGPIPRYECIGELDTLARIWSKLDVHAAPTGMDSIKLLDIHAGIPSVYKETSGAFVPQMLNLQAIDAMSFTKGCFPGQEIVARMQYLGKLKRRMYRGHIAVDSPAAPGTPIVCHGQGDQSVGTLIEACVSPDGGCDALAVIANDRVDSKLFLNDIHGPAFELKQLPYSLEKPE